MKKVILLGALFVGAIGFTSATLVNTSDAVEVSNAASSFKLINDTGSKVKVYTGSGYVSLNNGSGTSISCKSSKEVKVDGKTIFKISEDLCGKTVKISSYM